MTHSPFSDEGLQGKTLVTAVFPNFTTPMYVHPESENISNMLRGRGWYSRGDLEIYNKLLAPGDTYIDIGANIGWYSIYAASIVGSGGAVLAFEPDAKNCELLRKNVVAGGFRQIHVYEKAVMGVGGEIKSLSKSPDNFGDHAFLDPSYSDPEDREMVPVETVTIDSLESPLFERLSLVKIDIQGAEPDALRGMQKTVNRYRPILLLEYSPGLIPRFGGSSFEIFAYIEKGRFVPYRLTNDNLNKRAVVEALSVQELFDFTIKESGRDVGWDLLLVPYERSEQFKAKLK